MMDNDFGKLYKPLGQMKPLGVSNCLSSFDRKSGFYGSLPKSSPITTVRKTLFETKNKENDESTLCKDFANREATGKSPIVLSHRLRIGSNSDESQAGRKIKPRRSMLGQRSKNLRPSFSKDDSTYTLSKPLHSSSPLNDIRQNSYRTDTRLLKATSTPTLSHPFDSQDPDASAFFSKGLSDSTWSVFKSNKRPDNSEEYTSETPFGRGMAVGRSSNAFQVKPSLIVPTADQRMKLERLASKFKQNESLTSNSPTEQGRYFIENTQKLKGCQPNNILGARTRGQLKREKEKCLSEVISPVCNPKENILPTEKIEDKTKETFSTPEKTDSSWDSADSYIHNEATIVGTCIKKLDDINEESLTEMNIPTKMDEESENPEGSGECESSQKNVNDLNSILNLFQNLQKEKEEIDNKLSALVQQKNSFDKKWNELNCAISSYTNSTDERLIRNSVEKPKFSKTICTKVRRSFIMSPRASLAISKSKIHTSTNYSELKASFSCLKTPVQSVKEKKFRKSTCYTPNSLSVLIHDQAKDIFGDM